MKHSVRTCPACGNDLFRFLFSKMSSTGIRYDLYRCTVCALETISPLPDQEELDNCYQGDYFEKRTDRGYDNYYSDPVRREIERVFRLNLADLGFDRFNSTLTEPRLSLDIGCAAGYFVGYMKSIGWDAQGIEVSRPCTDYAVNTLGLTVITGDYLTQKFSSQFDLITMWATIEHLPYPERFMEKIARDLKPGGMLIISTCRANRFAFRSLFGSAWRYYNVPEHVCYFTDQSMKLLLENFGFSIEKRITYGSGVGRAGTLRKKAADWAAKHLRLGDMMALSARKLAQTETSQCEQPDQLQRFAILSDR